MTAGAHDLAFVGDLAIDVDRDGGRVVVTPHGEVDVYTAAQLRELLIDLVVNHGDRDVSVQLADVSFIDSTGLTALVGVRKRLGERGGTLTLLDPTPKAFKVLEIMGLTPVRHRPFVVPRLRGSSALGLRSQ